MKFALFIVFSLLACAFAVPVPLGTGSLLAGTVTGVLASAGGAILGM